MERFQRLLTTVDRLLGPGGCPWDREQTLNSMRSALLEESCELIEAIDLEESEHIQEELGDLFFILIFLCRLMEKEGKGKTEDVLEGIIKKLIYRHPHVFGDVCVESVEAVLEQWADLKQKEKSKALRKSSLDGIPKGLPALALATNYYGKMKKKGFADFVVNESEVTFENEEELGDLLFTIVVKAKEKKLDPEQALRKKLAILEQVFRRFEEG